MSDALERATGALGRGVSDVRNGFVPVLLDDARTILAALREREQAIAAEREACAARCMSIANGHSNARVGSERRHTTEAMAAGAKMCAAAIRARGKEAGDE